MKLTTTQITKIEETLVLNGLIYDDIKLEVTDHIASEIEAEMNNNNISFEEAFKQAFENWEEQLRPSTSLWTGSKNVAPRIVIQKLVFDTRKQFLVGLLFVFALSLSLSFFLKSSKNENLIEIVRNILKGIYLIEIVIIIASRYFVWKSKLITSFKLLSKNLNPWAMVVLLFFGIGFMPLLPITENFKIILVSSFFASFYLFWPISYAFLIYKHFQFERNLSISEL
jgi:hypothetical protein